MNYTLKDVEGILSRVWEDRIKGGGWSDKQTFIDKMKVVKKLTLTSVGVSETELVCLYCKDKVKKEDIVIQCDECYGVNHP